MNSLSRAAAFFVGAARGLPSPRLQPPHVAILRQSVQQPPPGHVTEEFGRSVALGRRLRQFIEPLLLTGVGRRLRVQLRGVATNQPPQATLHTESDAAKAVLGEIQGSAARRRRQSMNRSRQRLRRRPSIALLGAGDMPRGSRIGVVIQLADQSLQFIRRGGLRRFAPCGRQPLAPKRNPPANFSRGRSGCTLSRSNCSDKIEAASVRLSHSSICSAAWQRTEENGSSKSAIFSWILAVKTDC